MKIHYINNPYLEEHQNLSMKQISKTGALIAAALVAGNLLLSSIHAAPVERVPISIPVILNVPSESINSMNIIINDDQCSDSFFQEVCSELQKDGLVFEVTSNNQNINQDNHVVITIDQQYHSGTSNYIFSPFDNTRLGESDSLALAMKAGLEECGLKEGEIVSGRIGYRIDENGNVQHQVPTPTEEAINPNYDTSFVTISLGTDCNDPVMVAKGIESGLSRQKYYLEHYDLQTDLLYRSDYGESVQVVADYFGSSVRDLNRMNNLRDEDTLRSQTIINPSVSSIPTFNKDSQFLIQFEANKPY